MLEYGPMFNECLEALGKHAVVFEGQDAKSIRDATVNLFPHNLGSGLNWSEVRDHVRIDSYDFAPILCMPDEEINVFVIWPYSEPIIKTTLAKVLANIDDVEAVNFDTYIYCIETKHLIEIHFSGRITIGRMPGTL